MKWQLMQLCIANASRCRQRILNDAVLLVCCVAMSAYPIKFDKELAFACVVIKPKPALNDG